MTARGPNPGRSTGHAVKRDGAHAGEQGED